FQLICLLAILRHYPSVPPRLTQIKSIPSQGYTNIARHTVRKIDDLIFDLVATRLKMLLPKIEDLPRQAGERVLPARLLLVDGAAAIGADLVREGTDQNLRQPVVDRTIDDIGRPLHA